MSTDDKKHRPPLDEKALEEISTAGERIYAKIKTQLEQRYGGQFAAIDVDTEKVYTADLIDDAVSLARKSAPRGRFHLVKIGSPSAFRVSHFFHHASSRVL